MGCLSLRQYDDFIEHLHENGFSETIEIEELWVEYDDWAAENVE